MKRYIRLRTRQDFEQCDGMPFAMREWMSKCCSQLWCRHTPTADKSWAEEDRVAFNASDMAYLQLLPCEAKREICLFSRKRCIPEVIMHRGKPRNQDMDSLIRNKTIVYNKLSKFCQRRTSGTLNGKRRIAIPENGWNVMKTCHHAPNMAIRTTL